MTDKFQNKYRIPSARLQHWDYGSNAIYFITICTAHRECYFGNIVDGKMELSEIGEIAQQFWNEIPKHFPFITLGEFVIMPNHMHGIIIIDNPNNNVIDNPPVETPNLGVSNNPNLGVSNNPNLGVSNNPTLGVSNNPTQQRTFNASKKWNSASLGVIINQYKRIVTINSRKIHADFGWQSRFHDHIIRNNDSFIHISNYIINNPLKWTDDTFYNNVNL